MVTVWEFMNYYQDLDCILFEARLTSQLGSQAFDSVQESFGMKVSVQLDIPQLCIVMDELKLPINTEIFPCQ